jgi:uncharacterized protein
MMASEAAKPRILSRPFYMLTLLASADAAPIQGRTRLEKLTFLIQKELVEDQKLGISEDAYHFRPLHYGPFTEEVLDDVTTLQVLGLVDVTGSEDAAQVFRLTEKGKTAFERLLARGGLPKRLLEGVRKIKTTYGRMPMDELLSRVYNSYPGYTTKSVIRDRYLY